MRNVILAAVLALGLAGCAGGVSVFQGGTSFTATIQNPVTPKMLVDVERGLTVAVAGLNTYKRLCVRKVIDRSCRATIERLQVYTRKLPPVLASLRRFVRDNDQVNAIIAYNTARQLLADFQRTAAANGVN